MILSDLEKAMIKYGLCRHEDIKIMREHKERMKIKKWKRKMKRGKK